MKLDIQDSKDRLDVLEGITITSINEQISAINTSISDLKDMDESLDAYIKALETTATDLQKQVNDANAEIAKVESELGEEITALEQSLLNELNSAKEAIQAELSAINKTLDDLKAADTALDKKIADLRTYVDAELASTKDWANATFSTLVQYEQTQTEISTIKASIEQINAGMIALETRLNSKIATDIQSAIDTLRSELSTDYISKIENAVNTVTQAYTAAISSAKDEITTAYTAAIATAIIESETNMQAWVNAVLAQGYYDIVTIDGKLSALSTRLDETDSDLQKQITEQKTALETSKKELTEAYKNAIKAAIDENNGVINGKISEEIAGVNEKISKLAASIEECILSLESTVEEIMDMIQSVVYIPEYSNGTAYVDVETKTVEMNFKISPSTVVAALETLWRDALSVKYVITTATKAAPTMNDLTINSAEFDTSLGVVTLVVSCADLSASFYEGSSSASAVLFISDGLTNLSSEFVPLTPCDKGPVSFALEELTEVSATFTGRLDIPAEDLPYSQVTIYYASNEEVFNINNARSLSTASFDYNKFTIKINKLVPGIKYNYCLVAEVKSEKTYSEIKDFTTVSLIAPTLNAASEICPASAVVSGMVNLPLETVSGLKYGLQYSTSQGFDSDVFTKEVKELDSQSGFCVAITSLTPITTYYYRSYIKMNGKTVYGDSKSFKTQEFVLSQPSGYTNLASVSSANCYIVSKGGSYCLPVVRGNSSSDWLYQTNVSEVLWESFGTSTAPSVGDLIKSVSYKDGYIAFQTAYTFNEGNAVIAAKDVEGNIIWSWHIWLTDQPEGQEYYNNAGIMMDRNLGATSATPGDVGVLGLMYQWGRKDPFLGSSSISSGLLAKSTITWSVVNSDASNGTIEYATAHPTTFIYNDSDPYDWYYLTDDTRWTTSETAKSIYDPCPAGWRVPDGGRNSVWLKALGSSSSFDYTYDNTNNGMNFSSKFGSASTIWYPSSGYHYGNSSTNTSVGGVGYYWSASPTSNNAYVLRIMSSGSVSMTGTRNRVQGLSVRCVRVIDEVAGANANE